MKRGTRMKLQELLLALDVVDTKNENNELSIANIAYHSKKVKENDLFVCVRGYQTDGHKYLKQATESGAVAAIVEEFNDNLSIPQYKVKCGRTALARLANKFFNYPSKELKMIGITATNGKTTTSYLANAILEQEGLKTGLIGTVAIKIDDQTIPAELTTPESLDLQMYLRQMKDKQVTHCTMEVSSQSIEMDRIHGVEYDIVTLNNVSREHIDAHGTFEAYFEMKSRLIRHASSQALAILNLDDKYSASLVDQTKAKVVTFGVENKTADIIVKDLDLSTGRGKFKVVITRELDLQGHRYIPGEFEIELSVPGLHTVYNSMVAIIIALANGVKITTIQQTLSSFKGVERRFEFIYEEDFKIIDDHFANVGNIDVTLETLNFMDYKDLHLVYAIRGNRGVTVNKENAETIVKWAEKLGLTKIIATKSKSIVTKKDEVLKEEEEIFLQVMKGAQIEVLLFDELEDAVVKGIEEATKDDLVLLAGCQGMDYGAEAALQHIEKKHRPKNRQTLYLPLKTRIVANKEFIASIYE